MPEIVFKGKEYVYNHHLTVPYRPLIADAARGIGPPYNTGNAGWCYNDNVNNPS